MRLHVASVKPEKANEARNLSLRLTALRMGGFSNGKGWRNKKRAARGGSKGKNREASNKWTGEPPDIYLDRTESLILS
jgi:hypothetical protein